MDWNAFVQGLLTNWLSDAIVVGGGIVLAILKKRGSRWAGTIAYGFAGSAFLAIIVYAFTGHALLSRETPHTTPENIESNIRAWADKFSLGIQKETDDKYKFVYFVSLPSGRGVFVGPPKDREGYLQFQGNMTLAPEHIAYLKTMTPAQLERMQDEITIEMARAKIGFGVMVPFKGIFVTKTVPITSNLTADSFTSDLDEIDSSMLLAREAIRLAFFHSGMKTPEAMLRPALSQ